MEKRRSNKFLKKLALRIKELREKHGVTQANFYNDTGVNIGRIERAKRDFSMTSFEIICKYFEITPAEFFKDID